MCVWCMCVCVRSFVDCGLGGKVGSSQGAKDEGLVRMCKFKQMHYYYCIARKLIVKDNLTIVNANIQTQHLNPTFYPTTRAQFSQQIVCVIL